MKRFTTLTCVVAILVSLSACAPSAAQRNAAMVAEEAVTDARITEIHAEHDRRIAQASTTQEKQIITQWRMDELSKVMTDHHARMDEHVAEWRGN